MSYVPTWKGGKRMIGLTHYFHADMAYMAEADPDCISWDVDTTPMEYANDDEVGTFIPDLVLATKDGLRLVRLVDASDRQADAKPGKVTEVPPPREGLTFECYTRSQLSKHPRLKASRDILYHRIRRLADEFPMQVAGMFAMRPFATLGDLHGRLGGGREIWFDLLALIGQGFIEVDMDQPLDLEMPVRACSHKGHLG
jgi:hypothetical protein